MNNGTTEREGVMAVEHYLNATGYIQPFLATNDKGPLWDGDFCVYKEKDDFSNENLKFRVPVQIKSSDYTQRKVPTFAKRSIKVSALKKYRHEGGVVYFYILITGVDQHSLFYKILDKTGIERILSKAGDKKSVTILMEPIPKSPQTFMEQIEDFDLQRTHTVVKLKDIADSTDYTYKVNFTIPSREDPFAWIATHPTRLIITSNKTGCEFITEQVHVSPSMEIKGDVVAGGKTFFHKFSLSCSSKFEQYKIGKSLTINNPLSAEDPTVRPMTNISFHPTTVDEAIQELEFLKDFIESGSVNVGGTTFGFKEIDGEKKSFLDFCKHFLPFWKDAKKLFALLNIHEEFNPSTASDEAQKNLDILIHSFIHKKPVGSEDKNIGLLLLNLDNIHILVAAHSIGKDKYELQNAFNNEEVECREERDGKLWPVPFYSYVFTKADVLPSNIDLSHFISEYDHFKGKNIHIFDRAYYDVQCMLLHYDKSKKPMLLENAKKLQDWVSTNIDAKQYPILDVQNKISEYQIVIRSRGQLTKEEKQNLLELSEAVSKKNIKFAISILLGETDRAKMYFESLSPSEQNDLKEMPIYNLYNKK